MPGSVDDILGVAQKSAVRHGIESVVQAHEIRQAARTAHVAIDEDEKVRKALEHRSCPQRGPFNFGDYVCYWTKQLKDGPEGMWHGPGIIIGKHGEAHLSRSTAS